MHADLFGFTQLQQWEFEEFSRCALHMYRDGRIADGNLLEAVAAEDLVPTEEYDRAMYIYNAWLTGNEEEYENQEIVLTDAELEDEE